MKYVNLYSQQKKQKQLATKYIDGSPNETLLFKKHVIHTSRNDNLIIQIRLNV